MSQSLVQSGLGGHGSGSFTTAGGTLSAITYTVPQTTVAGNFLILVCTHHQTLTAGTGAMASSFNNPTGVTGWTTNGTSNYLINSGSGAGSQKVACQMFFKPNAASVPSTTVVSVAVGVNSGSASGNESYEFAFYEFSGVSILSGNNTIDTQATNNSTTGVPGTTNLTTAKTDLVIVTGVGNSGALTAASGYTLGITLANVSATSQMQYQLDTPSGTVATAFGSGSQTNCGCQAIAFLPPPATAKNNYGFFFG
jgi:hypothetical protein